MSKEDIRLNHTIRFLKWTKKYSGWWQLICEPGNEHMNLDMMQMLIKRLKEESLYEIIFVMLEVHKNQEFIRNLQNVMLKDLLISEWKNGNKDEIANKLIMYLE